MALIEEYKHAANGFPPLLITNNWQVAQINYAENQAVGNIASIDVHTETDETFVLLNGKAILISAKEIDGDYLFETTIMEHGVIYNIPRMCWHNIALNKGSKVLIVEDKDSHISKYKIVKLNDEQKSRLNKQLYSIEEEW